MFLFTSMIFQQEKLAAGEDTETASENSINCDLEKMDDDVSYERQDHQDEDDEIEIIEVNPESFSSFDEASYVTEVEVEKHESEAISKEKNELKVKNEHNWEPGIFEERNEEVSFEKIKEEVDDLKWEKNEEEDPLADNVIKKSLSESDFSLKADSKP